MDKTMLHEPFGVFSDPAGWCSWLTLGPALNRDHHLVESENAVNGSRTVILAVIVACRIDRTCNQDDSLTEIDRELQVVPPISSLFNISLVVPKIGKYTLPNMPDDIVLF